MAGTVVEFHYDLHGDNMSSLARAKTVRVNSLLARRANIIFITISMHLDACLSETEHVPRTMNIVFYVCPETFQHKIEGWTRC
jgi:hypothetical protein